MLASHYPVRPNRAHHRYAAVAVRQTEPSCGRCRPLTGRSDICPTAEPLARLKAQQSLRLATEVGKSNRLLERLLFSKVNWR